MTQKKRPGVCTHACFSLSWRDLVSSHLAWSSALLLFGGYWENLLRLHRYWWGEVRALGHDLEGMLFPQSLLSLFDF